MNVSRAYKFGLLTGTHLLHHIAVHWFIYSGLVDCLHVVKLVVSEKKKFKQRCKNSDIHRDILLGGN